MTRRGRVDAEADGRPEPARSCASTLPHRRHPCAQCPWRRDVPPGMFGADRYAALARTSGRPGDEAGLDAPIFACHKSPEGAEEACAGWLARAGADHLGIRLAVVQGRLPATALAPRDEWPDLFGSYEEMARTQADADVPG